MNSKYYTTGELTPEEFSGKTGRKILRRKLRNEKSIRFCNGTPGHGWLPDRLRQQRKQRHLWQSGWGFQRHWRPDGQRLLR